MGAIVHDLDAAVDFFLALGFVRDGAAEVSGPWMDKTIALTGARASMVMVSAPDGSGKLELTAFSEPAPAAGYQVLPADAHGLRHIAYRVKDVDAVVAKAREAGYGLVGELVDYEGIYRLGYIRGPEGLIVEVAQPLWEATAGG
ncbi:hypothetical protein B5P43_35890 [Bacillus sp. SRB_336]|nr:hypothetical protein B5P43_35890 [Bacillus sp. SRB_336]